MVDLEYSHYNFSIDHMGQHLTYNSYSGMVLSTSKRLSDFDPNQLSEKTKSWS